MDTLPDPRWQGALEHSRYLRDLLTARPTLIDELAGTWTQPLSAEQLHSALTPPAAEDNALKAQLRRLRHRAAADAVARHRLSPP